MFSYYQYRRGGIIVNYASEGSQDQHLLYIHSCSPSTNIRREVLVEHKREDLLYDHLLYHIILVREFIFRRLKNVDGRHGM